MFAMLPECLQKRQCELSDIMKCWGKRPWHRTVSDVWGLRWTVDFVSYIEVQIFKGYLTPSKMFTCKSRPWKPGSSILTFSVAIAPPAEQMRAMMLGCMDNTPENRKSSSLCGALSGKCHLYILPAISVLKPTSRQEIFPSLASRP